MAIDNDNKADEEFLYTTPVLQGKQIYMFSYLVDVIWSTYRLYP